jgi:hypothetical protein
VGGDTSPNRRATETRHLLKRLCVLLSRHRFACVVVARAGITDLLDRHPRSGPVYLDVPPKFPDGWRAQQAVMKHLERGEHKVHF